MSNGRAASTTPQRFIASIRPAGEDRRGGRALEHWIYTTPHQIILSMPVLGTTDCNPVQNG